MASLQRFSSHGQSYWRIVESYRRSDGKPSVRVLAHLGKADTLLARLQGQTPALSVRSVSCGAVNALQALAQELDVAVEIDRAVRTCGGEPQVRDGLTVGQTLVAAAIGRSCHPCSKRAFADWAAETSLPQRMGFEASALTSQHFWDQMDAMPVAAIASVEEAIVRRVVATEALGVETVAYDTTNFFTYIASTNQRPKMPQRGHNKQRRHDLRQLGLALVVSEQGQIPLGHVLYEGARADVKTFAQVLEPLHKRLTGLLRAHAQLTLVFDQGGESKDNLRALQASAVHYVTALKPSHHRRWLATVAGQLAPCRLSSGEEVPALKTTRAVHGREQTVVVMRSQLLYDGQRRGLQQDIERALAALARISGRPRGGIASVRAKVKRLCAGQYLRDVLKPTVTQDGDEVVVTPQIDAAARESLERDYFGLRVLTTDHDHWSTAQIIQAYRGQSRVERAFRDLKDPWFCAFRPQYHWTDQKLLVHAFTAMIGLLLARLLFHRAQKLGFSGTLRALFQQLTSLRTATLVHPSEGAGRPRLTHQLEQCDPQLESLARALSAVP